MNVKAYLFIAIVVSLLLATCLWCGFIYESRSQARVDASASYQEMKYDLLKSMISEVSEPKTDNGLHYVRNEIVKNIVKSRGAVEVYIRNDSVVNGAVDLTVPEAVIVRLQDDRYWFLYYPKASHEKPSLTVVLDGYSLLK